MDNNEFERQFDLKSILDEEGIKYRENSKHYFLDECPTCGGKDKLNVDKKSKLWVCWSCVQTDQFDENKHGRGNLWTFLQLIGFDVQQIRKMLKGRKFFKYTGDFQFASITNIHEEINDDRTKEIVPITIPKWLVYLDRTEDNIIQFKEAYDYLWKRHVRTKEQFQNFLLYYNPMQKRIVFPAITKDHQCIGLQSRDITERHKDKHPKCTNKECDMRFYYYFKGEEEDPKVCWSCGEPLEETFYPKSLNTQNFAKTEFFYNEQNINWTKPVVLVEGPFDAINVHNSMAFLGKMLSDTQFNILFEKSPPEIVLYMDGDTAGDDATKAIYKQLRGLIKVTMVYSEATDDPGSHDLKHNAERVEKRLEPMEWFTRKGFVHF